MKLFLAPTFDEVIRAEKSHTNGFDYLRIGLALAVLGVHVVNIANIEAWMLLWKTWFGPFERTILPAFFALSGFLVTGSLFRNNIPQFLTLRAVRIFPALAVEIVLSALVLGALVTTLPISDYLRSTEFHTYFLNIIGWIHYGLPGVFEGRQVNTQLWTIPFELECYIALVIVSMVGLVKKKKLFAGLLFLAVFVMTAMSVYLNSYQTGWNVPGRTLVLAFLFGVLGYLFKSNLKHSKLAFFVCSISAYIFLSFPNLVFLAAAPITYITIYVGLLRLPKVPFGDLSYGVYLFHFPIARTIHELSGRTMDWPPLLAMTILLSGAFAALSWKFVEKPVLDRKQKVQAWVAMVTDWVSEKTRPRAATE